ncbi:hypothetical protein C6Y40_06100 [Alteromonas alba]|uniref:Uncharacterized protein n=1 Tax=Alteromonas alba TaxID=2079529 RepID=A0A2S9VDC5_9ALTE|nr:hypothetical protein C6Y40_06100 [Alteromonas alba]|tara:strand:- start:21 stop:203 length:183 start_codon:yes stop_codon:yes gene_type:complete
MERDTPKDRWPAVKQSKKELRAGLKAMLRIALTLRGSLKIPEKTVAKATVFLWWCAGHGA